MASPKKWLIATNGSKYASEAVKHAAELYPELNTPPEVTILVAAADEDQEDNAKGIVEMANFAFEAKAKPGKSAHLLVRVGDPAETIVKVAREIKADHVFIGAADFKYDIHTEGPGGISNKIISDMHGVLTLVK